MRKITEESVEAFMTGRPFKKSNMEIHVQATEKGVPCVILMRLHGNLIATRHINPRTEKIEISNCGWKSNTTKERLNGIPNVSIHQKNFEWFLNGKPWDGKLIEVKQ